MQLIAIDFETKAIEPRPKYPPWPVGVAIGGGDQHPRYLHWGHHDSDPYDYKSAVATLEVILENPDYEFVFHNAAFDCCIIEEKLDLVVPWDRVHDTMLLAFLANPFGELSLKPLADSLLDQPSTEQDAVQDWLIRHGIVRANDKHWGAHICDAPASIVGPYAIGDITRALDLFKHFTEGGDNKFKERKEKRDTKRFHGTNTGIDPAVSAEILKGFL